MFETWTDKANSHGPCDMWTLISVRKAVLRLRLPHCRGKFGKYRRLSYQLAISFQLSSFLEGNEPLSRRKLLYPILH